MTGDAATLEKAREVESAYREGWRVNAIQPTDADYDAAYLQKCEDADWLQSKAYDALPATGVGEWKEPRTAKELQATIGRLQMKLYCLVAGNPSEGVSWPSHQHRRGE